MPSLDGITAHIFCDGEPLEEYSTAVDPADLSTVSCWVESSTDKQFSIKYQFQTQESCDWSYALHCDGLEMRCKRHAKKDKTCEIDAARDGDILRSMLFSEILETDSQVVAKKNLNHQLGLIKLEIWRIKAAGTRSKKAIQTGITIDESPVHESKKTLGAHRVKLGPLKAQKPRPDRENAVYLDKRPYRVFNFYYRPKCLLQAMGHVPPSTSSSVNPLKRNASQLSESSSESETDGEEEKIEAQMHVLQQIKDKLRKKKEAKRAKDGRSGSKRLKQEASEIVVPPGANEEIIELSSD